MELANTTILLVEKLPKRAVTSICVPHCERSEAKPPVERGAWKEAPDSDD